MPSACTLTCQCGRFVASVELSRPINRGICYCKDCQAFAFALGRATETLDVHGGSEIIQTAPQCIHFDEGAEHLACLRLTPRGLLRWHTSCCHTPICNTPASRKVSFVGLLHNGLQSHRPDFDRLFGSEVARVYTAGARVIAGAAQPKSGGLARSGWRMARIILGARITGVYRTNPFFDDMTGAPCVPPRVLSELELASVMAEVNA